MLIFVGKPTHLAISEVNKKNWTAFFGTYRNAVPCLFPVLSNVPCWQKKWIFSIRGISRGMWMECYLLPSGMNGSWFCLGFHEQPSVSTLSAFSHNSLGQNNSKLSLNSKSRHTPMQTICSSAMLLGWFWKQKPNFKASSLCYTLCVQGTWKR